MVMKRLSVLAMAMIVMASCAKENVQPNNEPTGEKAAHLQSSVFKLSKDLIDSIHEEGIVAYTS